MLVVVRAVVVGPGFSALLDLDETGKLVRARSPHGEAREQHFRDRVDRFHEHAKPGTSPEDVVSWLSRDNMYCSFHVVDGQDFDVVFESLTSLFVGGPGWGVPVIEPEDVKMFLAESYHWQDGASAAELAKSWVRAAGLPAPVRAVLEACPAYQDARLTRGHFEKQVHLPGRGFASHTDLMAYLTLCNNFGAVIAVEGKVAEDFGETVEIWNDGSANKGRRLVGLCAVLGLPVGQVEDLRYQLLHRTYSAVAEAKANVCQQAVMLVHSFSPELASFGDFQTFASRLGVPVTEVNTLSEEKQIGSVHLRLGWVADQRMA